MWSGAELFDFRVAQKPPYAVDQPFDWTKARLVGHFAAVANPVAEIEVWHAERAALLDLREDVVRAQARSGHVGIEERVDRGQTVFEKIDDADHRELALVAKLDEPGINPALQEKVRILVAA